MIRIEVVYALPDQQQVEALEFAAPVTIEQAVRASSIVKHHPHLDLTCTPFGVFGIRRPLDWLLADQDRVELYRPLLMSPTEARRLRARMKDDK